MQLQDTTAKMGALTIHNCRVSRHTPPVEMSAEGITLCATSSFHLPKLPKR